MTAPPRSELRTSLGGGGAVRWGGGRLGRGTGKRERKRKWGLEKKKKEIWPGEIW